MSPSWSSTLLATLTFLACNKKAATDRPSPGATADADLESPFAALEALHAPEGGVDAEPAPLLTYCHMDIGMCAQYTGLTAEEFQEAKEKCHGKGKVLDTTPCSEVDLLGTCEHWAAAEGITDKAKIYLTKSVGFKSVEYARRFCDTGTFFEAPPSLQPADAKAPVDTGRARDR